MIPKSLQNYVNNHLSYPVAVIGCRATNPEYSLKCCEYDLAVFSGLSPIHSPQLQPLNTTDNKMVRIGDDWLELIYLPQLSGQTFMSLKNMAVFREYDNLMIPSVNGFQRNMDKAYLKRTMKRFGKRYIIDSLFYHENITHNLSKHPLIAAMWLKIAAYSYLQGLLLLDGLNVMPLHELSQIRDLTMEHKNAADGIMSALECIGVERATKSSINRSLKDTIEFDNLIYGSSNLQDQELFIKKAKHLIDKKMLTDCYYYVGKRRASSLIRKTSAFLLHNSKLIQDSLDLSADRQFTERLHQNLFGACKYTLRNN